MSCMYVCMFIFFVYGGRVRNPFIRADFGLPLWIVLGVEGYSGIFVCIVFEMVRGVVDVLDVVVLAG